MKIKSLRLSPNCHLVITKILFATWMVVKKDCEYTNPSGLLGLGLEVAQMWHPWTYSSISVRILGHQNCRLVRCNVFRNPKCPAILTSWHCFSILGLNDVGVYSLSPRHASPTQWITNEWLVISHASDAIRHQFPSLTSLSIPLLVVSRLLVFPFVRVALRPAAPPPIYCCIGAYRTGHQPGTFSLPAHIWERNKALEILCPSNLFWRQFTGCLACLQILMVRPDLERVFTALQVVSPGL